MDGIDLDIAEGSITALGCSRHGLVLAAAGLGSEQALLVWVLIHEQADGTCGAGGQIFRYADLVALPKG